MRPARIDSWAVASCCTSAMALATTGSGSRSPPAIRALRATSVSTGAGDVSPRSCGRSRARRPSARPVSPTHRPDLPLPIAQQIARRNEHRDQLLAAARQGERPQPSPPGLATARKAQRLAQRLAARGGELLPRVVEECHAEVARPLEEEALRSATLRPVRPRPGDQPLASPSRTPVTVPGGHLERGEMSEEAVAAAARRRRPGPRRCGSDDAPRGGEAGAAPPDRPRRGRTSAPGIPGSSVEASEPPGLAAGDRRRTARRPARRPRRRRGVLSAGSRAPPSRSAVRRIATPRPSSAKTPKAPMPIRASNQGSARRRSAPGVFARLRRGRAGRARLEHAGARRRARTGAARCSVDLERRAIHELARK